MSQPLDPSEYVARLAFRRDLHQTLEEAHRKLRELHDIEINRIGQKLGIQEAEKKPTSFVKEATFTTLKFEPKKGERLTDFEVADKKNNLPDKFQQAYAILRQNNAVINSRYSGPDYEYSYWLYGEDRIFRQKRKPQT